MPRPASSIAAGVKRAAGGSPRSIRRRIAVLGLALVAAGASPAAEQPVRLRAIPADAVSLLLGGREGGDLEARIEIRPFERAGAAVEVVVELPESSVQALAASAIEAGAAPALELYVYALGAGRQVRAHLAERHPIGVRSEPTSSVGGGGAGAGAGAGAGLILRSLLGGLSGDERLRILVRDAGSTRFALREIGPAEPGASDAASTAAASRDRAAVRRGRRSRRSAEAATAAERLAEAEREERRAGARLLARGYEEILRAYGSGAGERAVEELRRFEVGALANAAGKNDAQRRAVLSEAQQTVAERLAEHEPDALVPLLLLHLEVHDRHTAGRELRLASHTRDRVAAVAELYARTGRAETAARLASHALTAIGSYLQSANQLTAGRALLERALALDPENLEARLAIALGRETHGDYAEALAQLEGLTGSGAHADEARLRRATLLARLGRPEEAVSIYESLVTGSRQTWIVELAYQELASLHLERGRTAAAAAALEQAVRRFPGDDTLLIQLAYALERDGNRLRSRRILETWDQRPRARRSEPPPRSRYQDGLAHVGRRSELLARSALALLPMLAGTLDSFAPGAQAGAA